jgi:hypothetical protein
MLFTFQDADWTSSNSFFKSKISGWTYDPTCFGAFVAVTSMNTLEYVRGELSPDGKWWLQRAGNASNPEKNNFWIYIVQEGDKFTLPAGGFLDVEPGDLVRISWADWLDCTSPIMYQYVMRRVAYYDENRNLVKTKHYHDMMKNIATPEPYKGCCCNYCLINLSADQIGANSAYINSRTYLVQPSNKPKVFSTCFDCSCLRPQQVTMSS